MAIQHLSEDVLSITLSAEPQSDGELETVIRYIELGGDCNIIINFSLVEILSSATLCNLMILERLLGGMGRRLILCSVPCHIDDVFVRVGLHKLFRFADDGFSALQSLNPSACHEPRLPMPGGGS